ncbi:hypothetical protein [Sporosarcina sp. HYO08]|uniref:hypothetical protein n=1 Tax=Sporosarcina sp. HYO08 TaxID=1759557 RepID=UPI0007998CD7|nr:hypothetical protein [Sporosarcina sp. HYO08]KXH79963.1 hypothetical protein AU377_10850 [Sporosarcina sp. HYO08]
MIRQTQIQNTAAAAQTNLVKPIVLKEGQLLFGQIRQLYPGQLAAVQVGAQKLIAKLEVPMKNGDQYYFQVSAIEPETRLKIIAGPIHAIEGKKPAAHVLIDALKVKGTPEMMSLLTWMTKNQVPLSRDELIKAESLMKSIENNRLKEGLNSIQKMSVLNLPFEKRHFHALLGVEMKEGLHKVFEPLRNLLESDINVPTTEKENLLNSLNQLSKPFAQAASGVLVSQVLQSLLKGAGTSSERFTLLQLLKNFQFVPEHTTLQNVQQVLGESTFNTGEHPMVFKTAVEQVISMPFDRSSLDNLLKLLGQQPAEQNGMLKAIYQHAEQSTDEVVRKMRQNAESIVASAIDSQAMKEAIRSLIHSLGLNYEAELLKEDSHIDRLASSLKPQLLALLQNPSLTSAVRDAAETVVLRLNGSLLHSGENGVQHQLVMQLPLEIFGQQIDATLQWNGRMKEDGQIDPAYARILFHLNLSFIAQTVIDMQIQNRVVSITIFNDLEQLKSIGGNLEAMLSDGLKNNGYKLSGVFFKSYLNKKEVEQEVLLQRKSSNRGVDIRI